MINESLKKQLEQVVWDFLSVNPTPDRVRLLVGHELAITVPTGSYNVAQWVVTQVLRSSTPSLLIQVIETSDTAGTLPEHHALASRLKADPSLWEAKSETTLWMPENKPFVDRDLVRERLKEMANGEGPGYVCIEGSKGHGKSTLTEYIRELSRKPDNTFNIVKRSFIAETSHDDDLVSVSSDLQLELKGRDLRDTTHEEPERQAEILAREISQSAIFATTPIWLIIDGLETSNTSPGIVRFINELTHHLQDSDVAHGLRMIVLAESRVIDSLNRVQRDMRITLPTVTENCLSSWLEKSIPGKREIIYRIASNKILESCERELSKFTNPEPRRLEELARQVKNVHSRLLRG